MKRFSKFIEESADTIRRLKAGDAAKKYAVSKGLESVGRDTMDGKTRHRYSTKGVAKGDKTYFGHMQHSQDHESQKQGNIETTYTEVKRVKNGIKRRTLDRKKHDTVKDASDHVSSLDDYKRKNNR